MIHFLRFSKRDTRAILALKAVGWAVFVGGMSIYAPKVIRAVWHDATTTFTAGLSATLVTGFVVLAHGEEFVRYTGALLQVLGDVLKAGGRHTEAILQVLGDVLKAVGRALYLAPRLIPICMQRGWLRRSGFTRNHLSVTLKASIVVAVCLASVAGDQRRGYEYADEPAAVPVPDDLTAKAREAHRELIALLDPLTYKKWIPEWKPVPGRVVIWTPPIPRAKPAQTQLAKRGPKGQQRSLTATRILQPELGSDEENADSRLGLVAIPTCNIFNEVLRPDVLTECQFAPSAD